MLKSHHQRKSPRTKCLFASWAARVKIALTLAHCQKRGSIWFNLALFGYVNIAPFLKVTATRAHICKRLRKPRIDSARLGIDFWAPEKVYKYGLCAGILEQSMWSWNRVGIGLSYRPARLHRVAESIPGLLKSLKIPSLQILQVSLCPGWNCHWPQAKATYLAHRQKSC